MKKIIALVLCTIILTGCTKEDYIKQNKKDLTTAFGKYEIKETEKNKEWTIKYTDSTNTKRSLKITSEKELYPQVVRETEKILTEKINNIVVDYFKKEDNVSVKTKAYKTENNTIKDFIPYKTSFYEFDNDVVYVNELEFKENISDRDIEMLIAYLMSNTPNGINIITNTKVYVIEGQRYFLKNNEEFYKELDKKNK